MHLLGVCLHGLLLDRLLPSLITAAKRPCCSTHCGSGGGAFSRIARYCSAYCSYCSAASGASCDMTLRRVIRR